MKKTIKNYTTDIAASKTIGDIQILLAKSGAKGIAMDFDNNGNIEALFFKLMVDDKELPFKLPAKPDAVYKVLHSHKRSQGGIHDESRRQNSLNVAWRIVKEWLEMQLTMVELEQAEAAEVFLPYLMTDGNKTLYQSMKTNSFLLPQGE